jgi:hypothetical protein
LVLLTTPNLAATAGKPVSSARANPLLEAGVLTRRGSGEAGDRYRYRYKAAGDARQLQRQAQRQRNWKKKKTEKKRRRKKTAKNTDTGALEAATATAAAGAAASDMWPSLSDDDGADGAMEEAGRLATVSAKGGFAEGIACVVCRSTKWERTLVRCLHLLLLLLLLLLLPLRLPLMAGGKQTRHTGSRSWFNPAGSSAQVLCDGCDDAYHTACMRPTLDEVPQTQWYCPLCVLAHGSPPSAHVKDCVRPAPWRSRLSGRAVYK